MTSSCGLLLLCWIAVVLFMGRKSQGSGNTWDWASFMPAMHTYNRAFDPCSGHPQLCRSLPTFCNKPLSSACLGGELSGQLRGRCPDGDVQDLRLFYVQPYYQEVELAWTQPCTARVWPGGVQSFQPRLGQVHHQHHISARVLWLHPCLEKLIPVYIPECLRAALGICKFQGWSCCLYMQLCTYGFKYVNSGSFLASNMRSVECVIAPGTQCWLCFGSAWRATRCVTHSKM